MRRNSRISTAALGAVLMLAVLPGASAQGYREETIPGTLSGRNAWDPSLGGGDMMGPAGLLQQADAAVARGQMRVATELLEQAETRLLSREVDAGAISTPAMGGAPAAIADARQAVSKGDRAGARMRIRAALAALGGSGPMPGEAPMPGTGSTIVVPGGSTVIVR